MQLSLSVSLFLSYALVLYGAATASCLVRLTRLAQRSIGKHMKLSSWMRRCSITHRQCIAHPSSFRCVRSRWLAHSCTVAVNLTVVLACLCLYAQAYVDRAVGQRALRPAAPTRAQSFERAARMQFTEPLIGMLVPRTRPEAAPPFLGPLPSMQLTEQQLQLLQKRGV